MADGKTARVDKDGIHLPASAREVRIEWQYVSHPKMDFDRTVTSFEQEYRRRWEQLLATGTEPVTSGTWQVPE
jgi:hypothetical protein